MTGGSTSGRTNDLSASTLDEILQFNQETEEWEVLRQKMTEPRWLHAVSVINFESVKGEGDLPLTCLYT